MDVTFSRRFDGTVQLQNKKVKLQFGKVGIYEPGFVVTSFENEVGMLLKTNEQKGKFVIAHKNFVLSETIKKDLEFQLNQIIRENGIYQPCC
jgi:hypothetical protein